MSAAVALWYFSVWLLASLPFAILIGNLTYVQVIKAKDY